MNEYSKNRRKIKAVILAGSRDFGRCPLASRLPVTLWPIAGKPVLEHLLKNLANQGIKQAVICSNGDTGLLQESIGGVNSVQLEFLKESLPVGTAGCIRDAAGDNTDSLLLVIQATVLSLPNINNMARNHRAGDFDVTVVLNQNEQKNNSSEIYICDPAVIKYIPKKGYCDIKEGLIPDLLRAGRGVHAMVSNQPIESFGNRSDYLKIVAGYLDKGCARSKDVRVAKSARLAQDIRIYGRAIIMDGAVISRNVIIFGPAIIGRNVSIGKNTFIENSVFWDDSSVGQNCQISSCVVDYKAVVPDDMVLGDQVVTYGQNHKIGSLQKYFRLKPLIEKISKKFPGLFCATRSWSIIW